MHARSILEEMNMKRVARGPLLWILLAVLLVLLGSSLVSNASGVKDVDTWQAVD